VYTRCEGQYREQVRPDRSLLASNTDTDSNLNTAVHTIADTGRHTNVEYQSSPQDIGVLEGPPKKAHETIGL
jgi:hypothetical protein